ncbi:bifunctional [glutamate--ammonia ligase]-adenylyl-L-tyrosine phosphorylase/[glutamate--ammonia-ligase] adenylyltransferase [Hahella sp. SMD15-11]|uniref:Bifunctional [glutamate--ammonia ligase]-adenylyl-L-tyrosine phosphorylase/[glutamate--ammonia-ligase] adenylyltransferase n=1 Tax=Thermohahella caldifontis TaxID=3142973 RepID=A0AB39V1V9_9GAMM
MCCPGHAVVAGGQLPALRQRQVLRVLPALAEAGLLPQEDAKVLAEAYRYLRKLEHALQGMDDRQTQTLPQDELGWQRLARIMGADGPEALRQRTLSIRNAVAERFEAVVASEHDEAREGADALHWRDLWLRVRQGEGSDAEDSGPLVEALRKLVAGSRFRHMHPQALERLDRFVPLLCAVLEDGQATEITIQRVFRLVEAVLRRSAYLALLVENPGALKLLVELFAASDWVASQITATPALLDELLNEATLTRPPERSELENELRQQLLRVPEDDLEGIMETLRQFRHAHVLRVAVSEIRGTLPVMKVSDYLTWLAEVILQAVFDVAWQDMVRRHGWPEAESEQAAREQFAMVGYGKLGGIELSYSSDLDLVFVHGETGSRTTGERSLDTAVFWARLGQKMVHLLSTRTHSGILYEVDMRLRPSGNAGLLVTSLEAFRKYQLNQAWTWEHQALVRARAVAGGQVASAEFEAVRREVLCQPRDPEVLRQAVLDMRERMYRELADRHAGEFDLKHDVGGIVDIEFMVQYLALRWAHVYPDVVEYSDNIRILEALGRHGLLSQEDANALIDLYQALRARIHLLALDRKPARVPEGTLDDARKFIRSVWQRVMVAPQGAG